MEQNPLSNRLYLCYLIIREGGKPVLYLLGNYNHTFDAKNRVFLPSKWRPFFDDKVILTPSISEKCILVYSEDSFENYVARIESLPTSDKDIADYRRYLFGNAFESTPDVQGRILVPSHMREHAEVNDKPVFLLGVNDHAEIWNPDVYEKRSENFGAMLESLKAHNV